MLTHPTHERLITLGLTGMAHALASNCTLVSITDTTVTLSLSLQHEPMLNTKLSDRIEQALIQHLKKSITLDIKITTAEMYTPLKAEQQANAARQQAAAETVKSDSDIKKIMSLFDATLDEDSIKAI